MSRAPDDARPSWEEDFAVSGEVSIQGVLGASVHDFWFIDPDDPDDPLRFGYAPLNGNPDFERVTQIVDGLGAWVSFTYRHAHEGVGDWVPQPTQIYPRLALTRPRVVVEQDDAEDRVTFHDYGAGANDAWGSGFLGWRDRTTKRNGRVLREESDFSRDASVPGYPFADGPSVVDARVSVDVSTQGTVGPGSHVECATIEDFDIIVTQEIGGPVFHTYPALNRTVRAVLPGEDPDSPQTACDDVLALHRYHESTLAQTQDAFATPLVRTNTVVGGETVVETLVDVVHDTSAWLLAKPGSKQVESCTADLTCETQTTSFTWDPTTGVLAMSVREPGDPELELSTQFAYDAHGNLAGTKQIDMAGKSRTALSMYDAEGVSPIWAENALGHRSYFVHDPATGFAYGIVDPEGVTDYREVDGFLRAVHAEHRASPMGAHDGNPVHTEFLDGEPGYSAMRVRTTQATGQFETVDLSTRGLMLRRTWRGMADALPSDLPTLPAGGDVYQEWTYDAFSRATSESLPQWVGLEPLGYRTWAYDDLDRLVTETEPQPGVTTTWEYRQGQGAVSSGPGTEITITDPDQRTLVLERDTHDRLVRVRESPDAHMCQEWGPFGRVEHVRRNCSPFATGPQPSTDYAYDTLGRVLSETDPAFGTRIFDYDGFGNLESSIDGNGSPTTYTNDALGRVRTRVDADGVAAWTYDSKRLGALSETSSPDGVVTELDYDSFGRVKWEQSRFRLVSTTGVSPTWRYTYGPGGRIDTIWYPNPGGLSFVAQHIYDGAGYDRAVIDGSSLELLWLAQRADPSGQLLAESFGNGAVTERLYDPLTLRPEEIRTFSGGSTVQYLWYGFTPGGDLDWRDAPLLGVQEDFEYDHVHRLTQSIVAAPGQSRQTDLTYDVLGNIATKSDVGTYVYDTEGRLDGFGAPLQDVDQDVAGRVTVRGPLTLGWTATDMIRELDDGSVTTTYRYDADGNRVSRRRDAGADAGYTVTSGDGYEGRYDLGGKTSEVTFRVRSTTGRVISERRHAFLPGGTWSVAEVKYVHDDHLASGSVQTDAAGNVTETLAYDPWGAARSGINWIAPYMGDLAEMASGFTGHQAELESNLTNMRGRMYDPTLARFMSADPFVSAPVGIQGWNGYSYVLNRPFAFTDPTGLELFEHSSSAFGTWFHDDADPWRRYGAICTGGVACGRRTSDGFGLQSSLGGDHQAEIMHESGMYIAPGLGTRDFMPGTEGHWVRGAQNLTSGASDYVEYMHALRAQQARIDRAEDAETRNRGLTRPHKPNALQNLAAAGQSLDRITAVVVLIGSFVNPVTAGIAAGVALGDDYADDGEVGFMTAANVILSLAHMKVPAANAASKVCFAAGTLVLTPDGLVRIENIDEGDLVWARHEESGVETWKVVTEVFITADREILDLEFQDEDGRVQRLRLTPEHPLWSVADGWKWAGDLAGGEQIDSLNGPLTLLSATSVAEPQMVFNLEVDGFHTYFVGESGVWAHNNCFDRVRRVNGLPKNARLSSNVDDVFARLSRNHGIDPKLASDRLHQIKPANGFGPADNVVFDMTGNVFNPSTGELMGSLTQGGAKLLP